MDFLTYAHFIKEHPPGTRGESPWVCNKTRISGACWKDGTSHVRHPIVGNAVDSLAKIIYRMGMNIFAP